MIHMIYLQGSSHQHIIKYGHIKFKLSSSNIRIPFPLETHQLLLQYTVSGLSQLQSVKSDNHYQYLIL